MGLGTRPSPVMIIMVIDVGRLNTLLGIIFSFGVVLASLELSTYVLDDFLSWSSVGSVGCLAVTHKLGVEDLWGLSASALTIVLQNVLLFEAVFYHGSVPLH